MHKRIVLLSCVVAFALLAVGLTFWLRFGRTPSFTIALRPTATASPSRVALPTANINLLEQSLNSPDIKQQAQALAVELRDDFLSQGQQMLPKGMSVKLKPDTFVVNGNHTSGLIEAATAAGHMYILHLVLEDGTWLILYTEEK